MGSVADLGPGSEGHTENRAYLKLICWGYKLTSYEDA